MRKALSMLTAIIFILIIGIIFALTLSMLGTSTQRTMDHYLANQAELLARGAVEYAVMAVGGSKPDEGSKCLNNININYNNTFDINISISYIGSGLPSECNVLDNTMSDAEENGTALIDIKVSLNPALLDANPPITYARRVIQKL